MSEVVVIIKGKPFKGNKIANEKGLKESAIYVTSQAKVLAPVNKKEGVGGQLRNSIMYKVGDGSEGGLNDSSGDKAEVVIESKPGKNSAYVGTNLDYGIYQEFGTRTMNAQPYLRPAGEKLKIDKLIPIFRKEMQKSLRQGTKIIKFSSAKGLV